MPTTHKATHGEGRGWKKGDTAGTHDTRMKGTDDIKPSSLQHYGSELRGPAPDAGKAR